MSNCKYRFPEDEIESGEYKGLRRSVVHCRKGICKYWDASKHECGYNGPVTGVFM